MSDFFESDFGDALSLAGRRKRYAAYLADWFADVALALSPKRRALRRQADAAPERRVLIVGVEVPGRPDDIHRVTRALATSRHEVTVSLVPMGDRGKFANIDAAIAAASAPLAHFDWLVVTDDDIAFAPGFLDDYLAIATAADLSLSQPAHRALSFTTFEMTRRNAFSLARETRFVEIGPLTVIRANAFADLVPFPASRYCWGIDLLWSALSQRKGWKMGVVDGAPVGHLRPVGASYDIAAATDEGRAMLSAYGIAYNRVDVIGPGRRVLGLF